MWWLTSAFAGSGWPALDAPANVGGGSADAALVVGIEDYWAVPDVPGAASNARDWYTWFTNARGTPAEHVHLLLDAEATKETMLAEAQRLRGEVGPDGTVWVVFVGHGAPSADGHDGLLLGADVRQTAVSVADRSLKRGDLLSAVGSSAVLVLDACFSGRDTSGAALVPGLQPMIPSYATASSGLVLSAGASDQFAGPLPGLERPAFSYLALGALQGWGDADRDGAVSASELVGYAADALRATVTDRVQVPERTGDDRVLAKAGRARAPDLAALRLAAPTAVAALKPPTAPAIEGGGLGVDVAVEQAFAAALAVEAKPFSTPAQVRDAWCGLARQSGGDHAYAAAAGETCGQWEAYASGLSRALSGLEEDYGALQKLLVLDTVDTARKAAAADQLLTTWGTLTQAHEPLRQVRQARDRLAAGHGARLPAWQGPLDAELRSEPHGAFFLPWDPTLVHWASSAWTMGAGRQSNDLTVIPTSFRLYAGPVDLGFGLTVFTRGKGAANEDDTGLGYTADLGFVPFVVRTSRRHPGEPRGSFLNPAVGLGLETGSWSACCTAGTALTDPQLEDVSATFLDLYVADTVYFTNGIGVRGELRPPPLWTPNGERIERGWTWTAAAVFNFAAAR